jgi:hypothetical protein
MQNPISCLVEARCKFSCHIGHYGLDFEQIRVIGHVFGEFYKKIMIQGIF